MNTEEVTDMLVAKLSLVLKREVSLFEETLVDWVVTQVELHLLEEEQA